MKSLNSLLLFIWIVVYLTACGGKPPTTPNPTDNTAPILSSSLPATGASAVPINAKLALIFSEAMDEDSLELTSTPSISLGNLTWNADSTSVAFDNGNFTASTPYTIIVKAKDLASNALGATTLSFTTSDTADTTAPDKPTGLVATPANTQVTLTWKANTETDIVGYTLYIGTAQDKLEAKDFVTTNSKTLTGLTNGTTYFFAIDAVDAANNHSEKTIPVSAIPTATVKDTTAPTIQSSDPIDGATGVNPNNPSIKIIFSEPMDTASLSLIFLPPNPTENIVVLSNLIELEPLATTPFNLSWSEADTVATLTLVPPDVLLLENTTFTLTLNAKDKAGNALSGDKDIVFTTSEEVPILISSAPQNGAKLNVEPFEIKLSFSKPMDTATVNVEPTLEPVDIPNYSQGWLLAWGENDTVLTITTSILPGYFLEDTIYTLLITGKSKSGLALANTTLSFTTIDDSTQPTVTQVSPIDETTDVPLSPLDVFIYFDDLMDEQSILAAVSSSPALPCEWQHFFFTDSANDKDLGSALACRSQTESFQPTTTYTISVSTDAKDTSGNNLNIGTCLRGPTDPPCAYTFTFKTLTPPPATGNLKLEISGLPIGQKRVRVTGPEFDSGLLDESTTFSNVLTGDYTVAASSFTVAPGKPACRIYTPTEELQFLIPVNKNQTSTVTVTYTSESCALPEF